ncbi:MAG: phosphatase PAP2 family protein [Cytophagales bacterium]|nr:phosphatase PAP2 family protein [Cytophagales bacterium]
MIDWIDKIDREVFLFFNAMHSEFSDKAWLFITDIPTWIPLYAFILFFMIKIFKKDSVFVVAGLLLVVLFCDQFTSGFMKPFFERLRPCHNPEIQGLVHVPGKCGGQYGFASGHSANSFGIAMFVWFVFRRYWNGTRIMFLWALLVAYSRVALGVHYPGDIVVGGAIGAFFGWFVFITVSEIFFRLKLEPLIKN